MLSKLVPVDITYCLFWEIPLSPVNVNWEQYWEIDEATYKNYAEGLRKRMWNSEIIKTLQQAVNQVGVPVVRSLALELCKKSIVFGMS